MLIEVIGYGCPQDLFDVQLDVHELLCVQEKNRMGNHFDRNVHQFPFRACVRGRGRRNDTVNALGGLENCLTLTAPDDIGTLTAEIVFFEPRSRNQVVYFSGDTVTYGQVASILERVLGRAFKHCVWTAPYLMQELEKDRTHHMKKYRAVFAQGRCVAWPKAGTFNEQQSIQVMTAEQWARENPRRLLNIRIDS